MSLNDEESERFEGEILRRILKMVEIPVNYHYIRTKEGLQVMIKQLEKSKFKYLHLSCHGNASGIAMTLNNTFRSKNGLYFKK